MNEKLQVIAGLGNPGLSYERTRHNAGFWLIDNLCLHLQSSWQLEKKLFGFISELSIEKKKIILFKPNLFMNESGRAIAALLNFFKFSPKSLLVAHDELDLNTGTIRFKFDGGHGGHNGLKDIINCLGSKTFYRCRIGIGHPGNRSEVHNYVLSTPSQLDYQKIVKSIDEVINYLPELVEGKISHIMQRIHTRNSYGI